jgi:hypothetical protein
VSETPEEIAAKCAKQLWASMIDGNVLADLMALFIVVGETSPEAKAAVESLSDQIKWVRVA